MNARSFNQQTKIDLFWTYYAIKKHVGKVNNAEYGRRKTEERASKNQVDGRHQGSDWAEFS